MDCEVLNSVEFSIELCRRDIVNIGGGGGSKYQTAFSWLSVEIASLRGIIFGYICCCVFWFSRQWIDSLPVALWSS